MEWSFDLIDFAPGLVPQVLFTRTSIIKFVDLAIRLVLSAMDRALVNAIDALVCPF